MKNEPNGEGLPQEQISEMEFANSVSSKYKTPISLFPDNFQYWNRIASKICQLIKPMLLKLWMDSLVLYWLQVMN